MKFVGRGAVVLLLNLTVMQSVFADSFGEKFRTWLLGSELRAETLEHDFPGLDRLSAGCIECHDGVLATNITLKDADSPLQFSNLGVQVNHPVGMDYDYYAATRRGGYTRRAVLDSNIILVDGKVTCVSCHRLRETGTSNSSIGANWDDNSSLKASADSCSASNELTVGPRQTDLCLACHKL